MVEQEGVPDHDHGPIQSGEAQAALTGVEELLNRVPFLPDYPLPEAPSNLERRFWLTRDKIGAVTEPWRDLPEDLFHRAHYGDVCARETVTSVSVAFDEETRTTTLSPEDAREIYRRTMQDYCLLPERFDLHDVYVCAEAMYLREYDRWQRNGGWYEYTALPTIRAALEVVGQAVNDEAGSDANR